MWHKQGEEIVYSGYRTVLKRTFATPDGVQELEIKLPGGHVDEGEAAAAARELLEETATATPRPVGSMLDCAYSTRVRHVFVADDAERVADSADGLEVVLLPLDEFRRHLRGGRLTDVGPAYQALDELGLLRG